MPCETLAEQRHFVPARSSPDVLEILDGNASELFDPAMGSSSNNYTDDHWGFTDFEDSNHKTARKSQYMQYHEIREERGQYSGQCVYEHCHEHQYLIINDFEEIPS